MINLSPLPSPVWINFSRKSPCYSSASDQELHVLLVNDNRIADSEALLHSLTRLRHITHLDTRRNPVTAMLVSKEAPFARESRCAFGGVESEL